MVTLAEIERLGAIVEANPMDYAALERWNAAVTAYETATGDLLLWCDNCGKRIAATTEPNADDAYLCAACAAGDE